MSDVKVLFLTLAGSSFAYGLAIWCLASVLKQALRRIKWLEDVLLKLPVE